MKEELSWEDCTYSTKIGSLLGFIVGWVIGVALVLYLDSSELNAWPVESIPLLNGFGWMLYGFIVGGGGIFANLGRKPLADAGMLHTKPQAA